MRTRERGLKSRTKNPSLSRQKPSRALRDSSNRLIAGRWPEALKRPGEGSCGTEESGNLQIDCAHRVPKSPVSILPPSKGHLVLSNVCGVRVADRSMITTPGYGPGNRINPDSV